MRKRTKRLLVSVAAAVPVAVAGGWAGAELSDLVTDAPSATAWGSLAGQYIAGMGVFTPLYGFLNRDVYRGEDRRFATGRLVKDMVKFSGGFAALDVAYLFGRPATTYAWQRWGGLDAGSASLASDAFWIPAYLSLVYPIAKFSGVLGRQD